MPSKVTSQISLSGEGRAYVGSTLISTHPASYKMQGVSSLLISSGHPVHWIRKKPKIIGRTLWYDIGGPFAVNKRSVYSYCPNLTTDETRVNFNGNTWEYSGFTAPLAPTSMSWPSVPTWTSAQISGLGTRGYRQTIPTEPESNVGQFLAELRDLPKLPLIHSFREKALFFKNLARNSGKEYLNAVFGWKPFVKDVYDATTATLTSKEHVAQFVRDSGQPVRRKRKLGKTVTNTTSTYVETYPSSPVVEGLSRQNNGTLTVNTRTTTSAWFSACYIYYVAPVGAKWYSPSSIKRGRQIANKLYGTEITPGLLWDLAPWSWMADYFGNIGDIVHNLSSFSSDNLVAQYAYLMTSSKAVKAFNKTGVRLGSGKLEPPSSIVLVVEEKRRYVGNPYSFGSSGDLTPKQAAILVALGLSRA